MIKEKYGFLELIYSEKYFDEDTGENFIKEDFVLDLKEWTEEEFPYEKHFSDRRQERALSSHYNQKR